jgi:hypothetical protein
MWSVKLANCGVAFISSRFAVEICGKKRLSREKMSGLF